jgi:hypothetical protein
MNPTPPVASRTRSHSSAAPGINSEFGYMAKHGYAGDFVAFPAVNQHEQEGNAAVLKAGSEAGRVTDATGGTEQLDQALEALVNEPFQQPEGPRFHLSSGAGSVAEMHRTSQSATSGPDHAANLLASLFAADEAAAEPMRGNAAMAMEAMKTYDAEKHAKESRSIFKLLVPALDAIIKGDEKCHIRSTPKVDLTELSVADVARHLSAIGLARGSRTRTVAVELMGVDFEHASSQHLAREMASELRDVMVNRDIEQRKAAAERMLTDLAVNRVALGR